MEWGDEKKELLATIRRQEQEAATLAKRFKLLQETLKEQQKLLDRYQRALGTSHINNNKPTQIAKISNIDKTRINNETTYGPKDAPSTWIKKKTSSSDLETEAEAPTSAPAKQEIQQKDMKAVFKPHAKRNIGRLAATWAEEKRRMQKKPKWEQTLKLAVSGANKENVRTERTDKPKGFAYVEVVRNREERKALPGHDCIECKKYYDAVGGIGGNDAATQKNKCSRHRARFEPYQTPDDFWRLSFPDSEPGPKCP